MRMRWEKIRPATGAQLARCFSPTNIALAKYWGKRDHRLNLPCNGSLSVTLKDLGTFTTVEFHPAFADDTIYFNGAPVPREAAAFFKKVESVLNELRRRAGTRQKARLQTKNNFPTGAGLASSASGLSAVAFAGAHALGLDLEKREISEIARRGSGSAARSLFGGYVYWSRGVKKDGRDSHGSEVAPAHHWPLNVTAAIVEERAKKNPSTLGMTMGAQSPFFKPWVDYAEKQLPRFRDAVLKRDFAKLAQLSETNCMAMHASAMPVYPPLLYWDSGTIGIMKLVWRMRAEGHSVFFTIDAGPNVFIFSEPSSAGLKTEHTLNRELKKITGVRVLQSTLGEGARLLGSEVES